MRSCVCAWCWLFWGPLPYKEQSQETRRRTPWKSLPGKLVSVSLVNWCRRFIVSFQLRSSTSGFSTVSSSIGHGSESTGRRLTSAEGPSYLGGSGGMLPQKIFKIEDSERPFPAFLEPRNHFPSKAWVHSWNSLKSKIFNKNGQLVGEVGVGTGNDKIFSRLSLYT